MREFWDNKFMEIKTGWGMQPSDSAIIARDFFQKQGLHDILIPGVGYGRNADLFIRSGFRVTGIEISEYAIRLAREEFQLDFPIYHGSVTNMPFDKKKYDGIFCYAMIHLLNKPQRKQFIKNCYNQLKPGGYMIFTVVSKKAEVFGKGRLLSDSRYELSKGLRVYFYDLQSANREFKNFSLFELHEIEEPIKHMESEPPLKCIMVKCRKREQE
jgi:SAM-dependent methyltransferase